MRRFLIVLSILATLSAVLGSEPGQRIGPEDIVFYVDGLVAESAGGPIVLDDCSEIEPYNPFLCDTRGTPYLPPVTIGVDAEGTLYTWTINPAAHGNEISRLRPNGDVELIASFPFTRAAGNTHIDHAAIDSMTIEQVGGAIYLTMLTACSRDSVPCGYKYAQELIRIRGLRPLAEVLKEQRRGQGRPERPW